MDCSPPGSSVHGIFQARIMKWVFISYSRGYSQLRDRNCNPCISCTGRQILYHLHHLGRPLEPILHPVVCISSSLTLLLPLPPPHWLEKSMATHSSTLAWKIPWAEEPGRLQSMGSRRVEHDWGTSLSLFTFMHWRRKWQPTPVFLPGESQGRGTWWAAVYGVAQSRTRLKWLSSSSSLPTGNH